MLKRTHLRHFIALAESGGFTAAARRLNLTQPTLSTSIGELERQLCTSLILRSRRGIRLTDAGHRLFTKARTIEREFRAVESMLQPSRTPVRPLALGVLASVSTPLITALRANFGDERPLVLIEGSDADLRRRLAERQIDAAVTLCRQNEIGESGPVIEERYAVLLSETHRFAERHELEAEELAAEAMIARRSCEILSETSKFFTARGVRPHFLMRSANEDRCLAMVRAGFAITTGPTSLALAGIKSVALQGYGFQRSIGLVFASGEPSESLNSAWAKVCCQFAF